MPDPIKRYISTIFIIRVVVLYSVLFCDNGQGGEKRGRPEAPPRVRGV